VATDVIMPQMGESIAEGTITSWLKKVGDTVNRDEPLFEISTDKVDAEIPSPAAGVLLEIKAQAGQTVAVNSVVASIGEAGDKPAAAAPAKAEAPKAEAKPAPAAAAKTEQPRAEQPRAEQARTEPSRAEQPRAEQSKAAAPAAKADHGQNGVSDEERRRTKSSPLVRKIASENEVDITQVQGTGMSGRVTKDDILGYIEKGPQSQPAAQARAPQGSAPSMPRQQAGQSQLLPSSGTSTGGGNPYDVKAPIPDGYRGRVFDGDKVEQLSTMRAKIAEHMVLSRRISAHVNTVWDIDFTRVAQLRAKYKGAWEERHGVNLTYTAFIMKAAIDALKNFPVMNASLDGNNVIYHRNINLGLAVALEWGLIVPDIHGADELNLLGLARRGVDLAGRARGRKLMPDEIAGGTFTITNPGQIGPMFNMPIINQPQVAIMGVGMVEKRPVVINDAIAIRTRAYLSLTFDHRLIDGAVADNFMAKVKKNIEEFDENQL
jgi:pyruvate dehydrogenase E2 component (dihydrolipoamide acetyltransferase)